MGVIAKLKTDCMRRAQTLQGVRSTAYSVAKKRGAGGAIGVRLIEREKRVGDTFKRACGGVVKGKTKVLFMACYVL